jgi:pSer/pThr/pTyr-binding forkhead associated (FHA) protein
MLKNQEKLLIIKVSDPFLIGSNPSCDLCIKDEDTSQYHAKISVFDEKMNLNIVDLNSEKGLWERLSP